jgi:hypothetical protein
LRARTAVFLLFAALGLAFAVTPVIAGSSTTTGRSSERSVEGAAEGAYEVLEAADQYAEARTAPGDAVDAGAFSDAYLAAKNLPVYGGPWNEITTKPYDSDAQGYRDPVWSNSGGGAAVVSGRVTALANDGKTLYAGTADGGVWKRGSGGWQPLTDDSPTLSIGALAVSSDHSVWVGTGEANTSSDSYAGIGVLRSTDGGSNWSRVGGNELANTLIAKLVFTDKTVFAATSKGLWKHSAVGSFTTPWTRVLYPANCSQSGATPDTRYVSDVAVQPNTGGQDVVAVIGWRAGSVCNGFYFSTAATRSSARASAARSTSSTSAASRSATRATARSCMQSCRTRRCSTSSRPTSAEQS